VCFVVVLCVFFFAMMILPRHRPVPRRIQDIITADIVFLSSPCFYLCGCVCVCVCVNAHLVSSGCDWVLLTLIFRPFLFSVLSLSMVQAYNTYMFRPRVHLVWPARPSGQPVWSCSRFVVNCLWFVVICLGRHVWLTLLWLVGVLVVLCLFLTYGGVFSWVFFPPVHVDISACASRPLSDNRALFRTTNRMGTYSRNWRSCARAHTCKNT
jgi:hypothetical protein